MFESHLRAFVSVFVFGVVYVALASAQTSCEAVQQQAKHAQAALVKLENLPDSDKVRSARELVHKKLTELQANADKCAEQIQAEFEAEMQASAAGPTASAGDGTHPPNSKDSAPPPASGTASAAAATTSTTSASASDPSPDQEKKDNPAKREPACTDCRSGGEVVT
jgi:hypothetical protein